LIDHGATAFHGSDKGRKRPKEPHQAYLDTNLTMDNDAVRKLWDHYRPLITFEEPFRSSDVRLIGTKDMAGQRRRLA